MIEDRENSLAEFDELRHGAPSIALDSYAILPALRILAKHKLIEKISSPKLTCAAGDTATMEVNPMATDGKASDGLRLAVSAVQIDRRFKLDLRLDAIHDGQAYGLTHLVVAAPGQTVLIKANSGPTGSSPSENAPQLYVVVTPKLVSEVGMRRSRMFGYGLGIADF